MPYQYLKSAAKAHLNLGIDITWMNKNLNGKHFRLKTLNLLNGLIALRYRVTDNRFAIPFTVNDNTPHRMGQLSVRLNVETNIGSIIDNMVQDKMQELENERKEMRDRFLTPEEKELLNGTTLSNG